MKIDKDSWKLEEWQVYALILIIAIWIVGLALIALFPQKV